MRWIISLAALVCACGSIQEHAPTLQSVSAYVNEFYDSCANHGADCAAIDGVLVSPLESPDDGHVLGRCYRTGGKRIIAVADTPMSEIKARAVVFHELGHCALDLDHVYSQNSLMASRIPVDDDLRSLWGHLVADLFDSRGDKDG